MNVFNSGLTIIQYAIGLGVFLIIALSVLCFIGEIIDRITGKFVASWLFPLAFLLFTIFVHIVGLAIEM